MAAFDTSNIKLQTGPLQNLFVDVKKILDYMEVKNSPKATENETDESKAYTELWIAANEHEDSYITYKNWWDKEMFIEVDNSIKTADYNKYIDKPALVPFKYRDHVLERSRAAFLASYVEQNKYYRMLNGLPAIDDSDYIYLSKDLAAEYGVSVDTPVHELTVYQQNRWMNTDEYQTVLSEHSDKEYLKYLGNKKIDIYTARKAKDFDIIRYPTDRAAINPILLDAFSQIYADCREVVMVVLYNSQLEQIYSGYRDFIGLLIVFWTLMQIGNKAIDESHSNRFMDDTTIYTLLSMYNIPDSLLLTKEVRRNLGHQLAKLVREKGTDDVYYDIIDVLGYTDVVINKLMLMRGDTFDENGNPTGKKEPYFLALDILDDNPYETIANGKAKVYGYQEITGADPMWWEDDEVKKIVQDRNYTIADSKYITIEATIHQMQYMFESIYFSRMVIDNKSETENYMIEIPEVFGGTMVSVFDCVVALICATCMNNRLTGEIFTSTDKMLACAGFNFDFDLDILNEFLSTTKYVDKDRLHRYLSDIVINEESDLARMMLNVLDPLRRWLEHKIVVADNREEYLEYERIYRALFSYDANRNRFLDDFIMPINIIKKNYSLSDNDMLALQYFYPHSLSNVAVNVDDFNSERNNTRYHYPFLSITNRTNWYIHIIIDTPNGTDDRGYLYFYDVLNTDDVRTLTNPNGTRIFMDYEDDDKGWVVNQKAVDKALELIDALPDDDLKQAYFQVYTPILNSNGKGFDINTKLPQILRVGGTYKNILKDKIKMDIDGLCEEPKTYGEILYRNNRDMYNVIIGNDTFHKDKSTWMNNVVAIITALENELDLQMKYYEESVAGKDLFFKPLITLIKHFKSLLVDIAHTGIKYIFDDKMDAGGNSNMFKLFDEMPSSIHHIILAGSEYQSEFGLFDAELLTHHKIIMKDRSEEYHMDINEGFTSQQRTKRMGSMRMIDAVKFFKNGKEVDPNGHTSMWFNGEPGSGEYSNDEEILFRTRTSTEKVNLQVDLDGWEDFIESYNYDGDE